MDTGKILIGISLVMLSAAILVSPSHAMEYDHSFAAGGDVLFAGDLRTDAGVPASLKTTMDPAEEQDTVKAVRFSKREYRSGSPESFSPQSPARQP